MQINTEPGLDYNRIAKVMQFLDWRWVNNGRVPTIPEMKAHVEDFKSRLKDGDSTSIASGGFKVTRLKSEEDEATVWRVEFILTDWDY